MIKSRIRIFAIAVPIIVMALILSYGIGHMTQKSEIVDACNYYGQFFDGGYVYDCHKIKTE